MRRAVQVTFGLLAVFALIRPFDCFAAGPQSREAAQCCLKDKCLPTANADECCKTGVPERDQLAPKSIDHRPVLISLAWAAVLSLDAPLTITNLSNPVKHPPPRLSLISAGLPLLI